MPPSDPTVVLWFTSALIGVGKKKVAEKSAAAGQKTNQVRPICVPVFEYGAELRL